MPSEPSSKRERWKIGNRRLLRWLFPGDLLRAHSCYGRHARRLVNRMRVCFNVASGRNRCTIDAMFGAETEISMSNHSLVGLAVLAVLFMGSASLSGQATAPALASNVSKAGPNRPAEVPEGYVITPSGYFHPSCVLMIEEGETLLADGRVKHPDGTVGASVPVCSYPHYTATGLLVPADASEAGGANVATIGGWLEYVSATTATSFGEIAATWIVPPPPTTHDGQTLFFFPGFEDSNDVLSIVQPVLQWYPPGPWAVASWNCCIQGIVWESNPVKVNPGDTILGTITSACKAGLEYCANWTVLSEDETTGKKTKLNKSPSKGQVWNWGFGAVLEVYGVEQCGDFPANESVVFTVQLYDQNLNLISNPGWTGTPAATGISPDCNYGLNVTATQETLEY